MRMTRLICWVHLAALVVVVPAQGQDQLKTAHSQRLVVVTPRAYRDALTEFIEFKNQALPTRIAILEEVLSHYQGADDPERLKRFLYETWKKEGTGYALLVGDADAVPVRYMVLDRKTEPAFDYAFYPSDLYYADLADAAGKFEEWNGQQDDFHRGYYGEVRGEANKSDPINYDQIDYRPDIAVGRWPVNTPDEVAQVAAKSIAYEKQASRDLARRVGLISVGGWVDSRPCLDEVGSVWQSGWALERRYYADARRNDGTPPPTAQEVTQLLNRGLDILFHAGHGTSTAWAESLSLAQLKQLHNTERPPVMVSAGCSTAYFATLPPYEGYVDVEGTSHLGTSAGEVFTAPPPPPAPYQRGSCNPSGLGEGLVVGGPTGAVAYIGCNTGSQPCALTLLRGFAMGYQQCTTTQQVVRLGDCWSYAVSYYFDEEHLATLRPTESWYPPSVFFQGMKFMLFGDPSLRLPK
jgi:hypothetical protein